VGRIPGVGKVTEARMAKAGISTVGDIYAMELATLEYHFGSTACGFTNWLAASITTP
jgi:DNA polymerase-4